MSVANPKVDYCLADKSKGCRLQVSFKDSSYPQYFLINSLQVVKTVSHNATQPQRISKRLDIL
jgi:hypothetical protein